MQSDRSTNLFVQTLRDYRAAQKFRLHAFVVMPDHFHLLVTVGSDMTIERAVQLVKGGFAFRAGKELGLKAPIWQKGFSEVRVIDSDMFENQREYIYNNPVVANLSANAAAYPHSSAANKSELDPPPQSLSPVLRATAQRLKARPDTKRHSPALSVVVKDVESGPAQQRCCDNCTHDHLQRPVHPSHPQPPLRITINPRPKAASRTEPISPINPAFILGGMSL